MVYVRPHLLDIQLVPNGKGWFLATVRHINAAGPRVKVELTTQWGDAVRVEIDHDRMRELKLKPDGAGLPEPARKPRLHLPDLTVRHP